jgi:hypothetical protein
LKWGDLKPVNNVAQWKCHFIASNECSWWQQKFAVQILLREPIELHFQLPGYRIVQIGAVNPQGIEVGDVVSTSLEKKFLN